MVDSGHLPYLVGRIFKDDGNSLNEPLSKDRRWVDWYVEIKSWLKPRGEILKSESMRCLRGKNAKTFSNFWGNFFWD